MSVPPLFIAACLLFWGWQTGNLLAGAVLGLALETPRWARLRIDLGTKEHSTIADLSTVGFVLLAVLLGANRGVSRGILEAFTWLPVVLAPIFAAQLVSAQGRIPLSALFRYMRKLRQRNPEIRDPMVDVGPVYVAIALLAAGVANQRGPEYYAGVVLGTACLLYAARPRRANLAAGVLMLLAAAALGHAGQIGLVTLQGHIEEWILDLNLRVVDADPYRTRTEIGSLGRLKLYDAIVLRLYVPQKDAERVKLLHRGSYNTYVGNSWVARNANMDPVDSEADNETWILSPGDTAWTARIATRMEQGRALLGLPPGTIRIGSFPATFMRRNALGSVHATLAVDWAQYEAQGASAMSLYAPPSADDLAVPAAEQAVLARVVAELGLAGLAPSEAMRRVENHFAAHFAYAIYRQREVPRGETALGDFLTRTRAGHCEYFGSAATLLLRAAGIPARYATGYAVMEYSRLEGAFIVRARHAHAWTRAWTGERWADLDPTPAAWFAEEEKQAPLWQGVSDFFRWIGFEWSQRGEIKAGDAWYAVLVLLAIYLAWSVLRGRKRVREREAAAIARPSYPGEDSEFYAVEKTLPPREPSETHAAWVARISMNLDAEKLLRLRNALALHNRYRFDPDGLPAPERSALREICRSLAPQTE